MGAGDLWVPIFSHGNRAARPNRYNLMNIPSKHLSDAEAIRHELSLLRKRIAALHGRASFDGVDILLSVAESHVDQHLATLRRTDE